MGHLEGNFTPVPYIGRKVPKGLHCCQLMDSVSTRGKTGTNYRVPAVGEGAWSPIMLRMFLVSSVIICRLYKLTIPDQVHVTQHLTVFPF